MLGQRALAKLHVGRRVLQGQWRAHRSLCALHPLYDVVQRLAIVGHWQQVMQINAAESRPAQVVGEPRGVQSTDQSTEASQVALVERVRTADRQRDSVGHHAVGRPQGFKVRRLDATLGEEVLADDLEPTHGGPCSENRARVGPAEPYADSEVRYAQ